MRDTPDENRTRTVWWVRWPSRVWWTAKALVAGRIYYDDGTSERSSRRWVWKALGPHPDSWPVRHPWLGERDPCGCVRWRISHRPAIWCMNHPEGDEFNAWMREAMATTTTTTTTVHVYPGVTETNRLHSGGSTS